MYKDLEDEFDNNSTTSFIDYKTIFYKVLAIWPWIVVTLLISLGSAFYITSVTHPVYLVRAKFFIKEKEGALALFEKPAILDVGSLGLQNEMIVLKSKPIAKETLSKLDFNIEYYSKGTFRNQRIYKNAPILLQSDWTSPQVTNGLISLTWENNETFYLEFIDKNYSTYLPDGSSTPFQNIPEKTRYRFGEWIETDYFKILVNKIDPSASGEVLFRLRDEKSLINQFSSAIEIAPVERSSSIMSLSIKAPNVGIGIDYLNTLMSTYLELELNEKNEVYANTIEFIDSQVSGVAETLTFFEKQLETYRSENRIYDLSSEGAAVFVQLSELETQLKNEQFKRSYYQSLRDYLIRESYRDLVVPSGIGIDDPILNALIENLLALQVDKSRLLATLKPEAPQVKEVNRKIDDANKSIREILINVDQNSARLIKDLQGRIAVIEDSFRSLPQTEQNLIRIQRQFTLNENLYTFLMERRAEAAITKASNIANNKIIEPAEDGFAIAPRPFTNYFYATIIGLLFPVLIVVMREFFRTKIEDVKYLENKSNVPVIASILKNKTNESLVVLNHSKTGISEGFRSLRSSLKYILPAEEKITILLTSTISGEGKTFCSINLASVYSLTGKKTVLVGCDLRKPKIFNDFGLNNSKGLSTFLSGQEKDIKSIIIESGFDNLDLIFSGPVPPNPAELINSTKFFQLVADLKERYDVVILDTPPVGLVSETLDLLNIVDISLFVFRQNYSDRVFIDGLNTLKKNTKLRNVYALFNHVDPDKVAYGSGYSYGYGYGYYEDDKKK